MNEKLGDKTVRVCGKTVNSENGLELVSSGSFIEFSGGLSRICVTIAGSDGDKYYDAYMGLFLNGSNTPEKIWRVQDGIHEYEIFSREEKEQVTIRIMKLTEMQYGTAMIADIHADGEIHPTEPSERKLMFIGDSLTAGYGVSGCADDLIFTTETEDVTKGYSCLAAEKLHADAWFVCWSGGGITSRWIPPEEEAPLTDILMPEVFDRGSSLSFEPELIAINLGTNDASYTRGDAAKEKNFTERYASFVKKIAEIYPKSHILCMYGLMENTLTESVRKAEEMCRQEGVSCSFLALPLMQEKDGMGTGGHPSAVTHQKTAQVVADRIAEILDWKEQ